MKNKSLYRILSNTLIHSNYFHLVLDHFPLSKPGQFANILCQPDDRFLLRRPFSIYDACLSETHIIYKVIGEGTRCLSERKKGEWLDVIGPLGKGWNIDCTLSTVILVGGGVGMAPLWGIAKHFSKTSATLIAILGGKSVHDVLYPEAFEAQGAQVWRVTEDGSTPHQGRVTDILSDYLNQSIPYPVQIYTCGPHAMMHAVTLLADKHHIECQVSLESMMACGLGGCVGCVCDTINGYQKVCTEGPVFNAKEVLWSH